VLYSFEYPLPQSQLSDFPFAASGGQIVGSAVVVNPLGGNSYAHLWTPPGGQLVDLTPINSNAVANGTDGTHQVGYSGINGTHATLWSGTQSSAVDLHPTNLAGFESSIAYGVRGGQEVGIGYLNGPGVVSHALLWNGSAGSAVDLNPASFQNSRAIGTDGIHQVGGGFNSGVGNEHALLWSGTENSAVDLNPTNLVGFDGSLAYAIGGGQQVGIGQGSSTGGLGVSHALLWSGTANSAVDLHPTGFDNSTAFGTNGVNQVGYGSVMGNIGGTTTELRHALLWSGSATSVLDLNSLLPFASDYSVAYSIDAQGNVFGIAANGAGNFAIEWSPVPEPATMALFAAGALGLLSFRRNPFRRSVAPAARFGS
jgi:hypothetical protein